MHTHSQPEWNPPNADALLAPSSTVSSRAAPLAQIRDLVTFVAIRLDMSAEELVVAYVVIESCLRANKAILAPFSVRPLLIASCVISRKLLCDQKSTLGWACDQLSDVFTALDLDLLKALERQVLVVLDWRFPMQERTYQFYTEALFTAAANQ